MTRRLARLAQLSGTFRPANSERAAESFAAPADAVERMLYGYSILICLPDSMSSQPSVATGTVMRPSTLRGYALEAGFSDIEVLPIETEFFRFYRLLG